MMTVLIAMTLSELVIGAMSISRYGVMTVYRAILIDLLGEALWMIVLIVLSSIVLGPRPRYRCTTTVVHR